MNELSNLFSLKQIAFFNKNTEDQILAVEGVQDELLFGTSKGKIFRFKIDGDELAFINSFNFQSGSVVQISAVPREDLLLCIRNKALVHVVYSLLNPVVEIGPGSFESISVNQKFGNSRLVLFALATNKKQIHICKGVLTDEGLQMEIIEKISTNSNVIRLCFDGKSLCYATKNRYYVLDMNVHPRVHHELIDINESVNPHIVAIGKDEFAICGQDGLIGFAKSDGISSRAPIDLNLKVVDMMFVSPILYVIGSSIMVAYSILNESQKITIPCDNLNLLSYSSGHLILVSKEKRVFKLTLVDTHIEKIKEALQEKVENGLQLIQGLCSMFPDETIFDTCNQLIFEESMIRLSKNDTVTGLNLFLKTGVNPNMVLSRIKRLNANESSDSIDIDLETTEKFLDKLLCDDKFFDYSTIVHSYLIRLKILQDTIDINDVDQSFIDDKDLKDWLIANEFYCLLAEFYFEFDRVEDALAVWKAYAEKTNLSRQQLEPLTNRLLEIVKSNEANSGILTETLTWLAKIEPELTMELVKQMPEIDFNWLANAFESHPHLLLSCLEDRMEDNQKDPNFNINLVKIYTKILENNEKDWKVRNSLRNFLTTIQFDDKVANSIPNTKTFTSEHILYTATTETAADSIKKLIDEDLDAAEVLYVKFSSQQPSLIKLLIPKYIKKDNSQDMQERLLRLLCQIRPFHGIEQIISDLPSSYLTRDMITLFQSAVKEYSQRKSSVHLQLAIDKLVKENQLQSQRKKEAAFLYIDSSDLCDLCRLSLEQESIAFVNNKAVHSRCLRKQL